MIAYTLIELIKAIFGKITLQPSWDQLQAVVDHPINYRTYKLVKWEKPLATALNLNSNGSYIDGICGIWGIVRDWNGKFIISYSMFIGLSTSNEEESGAMLFGL